MLLVMINSKFYKLFSDEDACMNHFKALKEKHMVCPECGHQQFKWIPYRNAHQCCQCGKRIPLRKNTMLERSKLPYNYWYAAVHLMTTMKLSVSAKEVQRQLGHKFYQPIWELCHKIKDVMGRYDNRHKLRGNVEVDEAFFTCYTPAELKNKLLTRGSGSERKEKVVVMAESEFPDKPKKGGKIKALHHVRMVRGG